jgi:hypothetical protein
MTRLPVWQENLAAAFQYAQRTEFKWGTHDCCQFALRCIREVSGVDHAEKFSTYGCEAEALGIIWARGGVRNLLREALGEPKPAAFATQGDIVLIDMGMGEQPAVCMGVSSFAPGPRGLVWRRTSRAVAAWTV